MTCRFVSLVPVTQYSVVPQLLGHPHGFHKQDFVNLEAAGIHGKY